MVFERIETEEDAYWLGFWLADGSVSTRFNKVSMSLSAKDKEHLLKWVKYCKIGDVQEFIATCQSGSYPSVRCSDPKTKGNFIRVGIGPRKTYVGVFPSVPAQLQRHVVRGYFDGVHRIVYRQTWKYLP